ncbi:MAG: hypothetical protein VST72_04035 [Nitrospirota bacterium]|nr:hypothetical protein [Nitrospirota bacterium]
MKSAAKKGVSYSKSLVTETGRYVRATAEYTGLLTASYAVRSGNLLTSAVSRLAEPIKKISLNSPLKYCRETVSLVASLTSAGVKGLGNVIPGSGVKPPVLDPERIARIEEMLMRIDRRLAEMESGGRVHRSKTVTHAVTQEKAKLGGARDMLLRQLVEANKQLKEA